MQQIETNKEIRFRMNNNSITKGNSNKKISKTINSIRRNDRNSNSTKEKCKKKYRKRRGENRISNAGRMIRT